MRYGLLCCETTIPNELIENSLTHVNKLESGITRNNSGKITRNSSVNFIKQKEILEAFLNISFQVNKLAGWDLDINGIEPLQYGEYHSDGEYGWHVDQHAEVHKDNRVRKLSFSVFLNNDYEGGEFDLEVSNPASETRYISFNKNTKANTALFFHSDYWHRVRPVKKGIRKSLVGWILGPKYK